MEGIPTDFAPKEPAAEEEWERFYENLVQDFMEQNYGGIVSQVDITAFAVKYLHMHIVSAVFAEESENLTSFLGDGTSAVMIQQKEKLLRRVYPPGTIAVNRSLCQAGRDDNVAYYKCIYSARPGQFVRNHKLAGSHFAYRHAREAIARGTLPYRYF